MLAIYKREIQAFFASSIGYLVIGLFLIITGLFLWVFKGPFNIFDSGFADLDNFFLLAPWVFLFLIPAITMRSFSEEIKMGTLELLFIKPIAISHTVIAKFLGTLTLALIAIIPTFLYVYSVSQLGTTVGNLDMGIVVGSYFGLLLLIGSFIAIGLFTSTLTENQIVAFILGVVLCFFLFYGLEGVATVIPDGQISLFLENIGMKAHYSNISKGVLDTRDFIYFLSICLFFLYLTVAQLKNRNR
ncbi:gliding motility-associated ABC transporter permease subunit GldF [Flavobacteriaceae bacterium KMM 6897]|nr:gliding motility-associated ABC transporter permease subunit GldF [Flavobacteriaceae bacterium KMM 6897]